MIPLLIYLVVSQGPLVSFSPSLYNHSRLAFNAGHTFIALSDSLTPITRGYNIHRFTSKTIIHT